MNEKMTNTQRFKAILNDEAIDRLAVINPTSVATAQACVKLGIDFLKVHTDANLAASLAAYGADELGFDSVMPYFSVVLEAAALGCVIDWGSATDMPTVRKPIYSDPEQFRLPDDFLERTHVKAVVDAVMFLRKKAGPDNLVFGKAMGPWTLSYHLRGTEDFLIETLTDPEKAVEFLNRFKKITITMIQAQFDSGADAVTIADHATAELVSPDTYRKLLLPVHKEITRYFNDRTLILHCCGHTLDKIALFAEAGFDMFHFDSKNDISEALRLSGSMKLTGCINNSDVILNGGEEDVVRQTVKVMESGIRIVSPECAIPLKTPDANLRALTETVKERRGYA